MHVTRPVRSRVVRGRPDAEGTWALGGSSDGKGRATQLRGAPTTRGLHPNLGGQDGAVAVSLVLSRPMPRSQSVDGSAGDEASGYRCATPAG